MNEEISSIVEFSEDISSAERPNPLPVMEYEADIRGAQVKVSQKNGNKYGNLDLYVDPSQYPADYTDGNPDGTVLNYYFGSMEDTKAARYNIRKQVEALGLPAPSRSFDISSLIGVRVKVRVVHETFEGNPVARARSITRAG